LPHNYSEQLARTTASHVPRIVYRAEAFIRSHADQPIALHDVANAAGCTMQTLQLGFRQFRDMTPAVAIRQARFEAVQQALAAGKRMER
jgi:methylphosphotriester-DNA--protein-cysteine methyltransferase